MSDAATSVGQPTVNDDARIVVTADAQPFTVPEHRHACESCGSRKAVVYKKNGQIVCRCANALCKTFNAKFGRGEIIYCPSKAEMGEARSTVAATREGVPPKRRWDIFNRDGMRCVVCGATGPETILHAGHIISMKDGLENGLTQAELDSPHNLITLCDACNLGQGAASLGPKSYLLLRLAFARKKS